MCACYFRAEGQTFNVDEFLSNSPWQIDASICRKGEPKSVGAGLRDYSLFSVTITEDDGARVAQQISTCRAFIKKYRKELQRLHSYPGVQAVWFSLAYYLPIGEVYSIGPYFDSEFLSDLVSVGAEFEFNVFCCSAE